MKRTIKCAACGHEYLIDEALDVAELEDMIKRSGWTEASIDGRLIYLCPRCNQKGRDNDQ